MAQIENMKPMFKNFTKKINKKMNLIDLNQNLINFECHLSVKSDNKPFQALVITQEQLDNPDFSIEYQNVINGIINADIENKSNIYNNYCLLLKSDEEIEVNIKIEMLKFPDNIPIKNLQQNSQENLENYKNLPAHSGPVNVPFYKTNTFIWVIIFIGIILIIYLLFSDTKKNNTQTTISNAPLQNAPLQNAPLENASLDTSNSKNIVITSPPDNTKNLNVHNSPKIIMKSPNVKSNISSNMVKSPPSLLSKLKNTQI